LLEAAFAIIPYLFFKEKWANRKVGVSDSDYGVMPEEDMIEFEDRAVAFIDVLGFKALVNSATDNPESLSQLSGLVQLLEEAVPNLDTQVDNSVPNHLIPKHNYISDCIILSAPLTDAVRANYNGLEIVVMRVIQLTHFFLNAGYLIRGGISVGKVWHTASNIVGPAYQEAYLLEANGNEPIVIVSETAMATKRWGSRICLKHNEKCFVNGLHDFYIPNNTQHGVIEAAYEKYSSLVEKALNSSLPDSAKEKWAWFKTYLEMESIEGLKWAEA